VILVRCRPLILVCAFASIATTTFGVVDAAAAGLTVVVNSTGDSGWDGTPGVCETATGNGVCTLRAAFEVANANAGTVIDFAIPGPGVHVIMPGYPLPALTQAVTVDGASQPGYSAAPLIELSGASYSGNWQGIVLTGGHSTVRALDIVQWAAQGILIESDGNTIVGNYLGVAPDGQSPAGNANEGVLIIGGSYNTVGGTAVPDRNVISANGGSGVHIQRTAPTSPTGATGNIVEGNYIGTNATGDAALGNASDGIQLDWQAQGNTIGGSVPGAGNVVSGNGQAGGIVAYGNSSDTLIQGNYVGTNAAGTAALGGNIECGILLTSGSNTVGGTSAGARNVISGNGGGCGLGVGGSTTVEGNYIGTNAAGTAALGNGVGGQGESDIPAGLFIGSSNNQIGGSAPGAGNVISGNLEPGVWIISSASSPANGNVLQGNYIGTDSTATRAIGNTGAGVWIAGGAGNTIGGTVLGDANTIAHNTLSGVEVDVGTGNPIEGNSIFANAGLGIGLNYGGNGNESAPTVFSAFTGGSSTTITGISAVSGRVEVFTNPDCSDPEGAVFVGSTVSKNGSWKLTVPAVPIGRGITATVTDLQNDDTSAFSSCQPDQPPPPLIASMTPRSGSIKGGTTVTIVGRYLSATSVTFGNRYAAHFTVRSPTRITAVSPAGRRPGIVAVTVTTDSGDSASVAADNFTYNACVVPRLKGKTLRTATKALKRADCRLGKVRPKDRTTGRVKTQNPQPGKVLAPGSKVQVKLT
jgi:IPT/TIG domain/PASTA domain